MDGPMTAGALSVVVAVSAFVVAVAAWVGQEWAKSDNMAQQVLSSFTTRAVVDARARVSVLARRWARPSARSVATADALTLLYLLHGLAGLKADRKSRRAALARRNLAFHVREVVCALNPVLPHLHAQVCVSAAVAVANESLKATSGIPNAASKGSEVGSEFDLLDITECGVCRA